MTTKPTPAAEWRENGEPDPHAGHYEGPREKLTLGHMSDDALANGAFMNYNLPLDIARTLAEDKDYFAPICWMTAVKDRIRWLSRALVKAEVERDTYRELCAELVSTLRNLEVSANTVDYCYKKPSDKFSYSLLKLREGAEQSRLIVAKAEAILETKTS